MIGSTQDEPEIPLATQFDALAWRNIGPYRGGRATAVCGVSGNPLRYYLGTTGGLWRTDDAGQTWANCSDGYFASSSIGAIAVAPSDPNVIYVGTGEHSVRGVMTSAGDGVYRSTDGGKSWTHLGLANSKHIARIQVHPSDPDYAYVAVQGAVHGPTTLRGVYRTQDGGKTWERLLFIDETTGAAELVMDPTNPRILYAATWDHLRLPWQIRSGGSGSGLWKSTDGGNNWFKLERGLPAKMGKAGITVSPVDPNRLYANIEAERGGVYRSDDAGVTWQYIHSGRITVARAWYYMKIYADPQDRETVYVLNSPLLKSIDGGKTFEAVETPHYDQHDLWINPDNPAILALANDGGGTISFNTGISWTTQHNQPTGQFYRIATDNRFPYYIYSAQQDNSTVAIPSRSAAPGIGPDDWYPVAGGESAFLAFDPDNPELIYGGSYLGNVSVYDQTTGGVKDIMAYPIVGLATLPSQMKYRFNWNAPLITDPFDRRILYHGANVVLRSRDGGLSWVPISPDLTRNEPEKQGPGGIPFTNEGAGGEVYNTISYLAISERKAGEIWAGTDDGLLHLTQDGGLNWEQLYLPDSLEGVVNSIELSPHDAGVAYVTLLRYRFNDFRPFIFKTENYGRDWRRINFGIAPEDFVRVVRESPSRKGLLFAGTETGVYLSTDGGENWVRFQLNMPIVPINDLQFKQGDLVAATAGRAIWVLDNAEVLAQAVSVAERPERELFDLRPAYRLYPAGENYTGLPLGKNPPTGAMIDYYLAPGEDTLGLKLEITDGSGTVIRTFSSQTGKAGQLYEGGPDPQPLLPSRPGFNRFIWDLRREPIPHVPEVFMLGSYEGGMVIPGQYGLRLYVGEDRLRGRLEIRPDPRLAYPPSEYADQEAFLVNIEETVRELHFSVRQMQGTKRQILALRERIQPLSDQPELRDQADSLLAAIDRWERQLIQKEQKTYQDVINFPNRLNAELMDLHKRVDSADPRVSYGARRRLGDLQDQWRQLREKRDDILTNRLEAFNRLYRTQRLPAVLVPELGRPTETFQPREADRYGGNN
jgi:photosystem II stability/assembly factor-like uncharacterized protein